MPMVFSALLMLWPRKLAPLKIASAIPTAGIAYSIEETPSLFFQNLLNIARARSGSVSAAIALIRKSVALDYFMPCVGAAFIAAGVTRVLVAYRARLGRFQLW